MSDIFDDIQFDRFDLAAEPVDQPPVNINTSVHNYCPDCDLPMIVAGSEYQCELCGRIEVLVVPTECGSSSGGIRMSSGSGKGKFYNINTDYTRTQRKLIFDQLIHNQSSFSGNAFPMNVLNAAATQYNNIQKLIVGVNISDGKASPRKFVRRGSIKDEVLAALIYFEGIREGFVRKKKDIAAFMKLTNNGFSRGEDIVRNLAAENKIDIDTENEPIGGFIGRYLDELHIDENYSRFIIDLVNESESRKIGMTSQISSKVVGCIYIINAQCRLNISIAMIEKACDNIKKNTFMKFYKAVTANMTTFAPIFVRHDVPLIK